jgi:hypothetical protein
MVARPCCDTISAGAGDGTVLVADAGLMVTLPSSHDCGTRNKRRSQPERTLPPKQGLEK